MSHIDVDTFREYLQMFHRPTSEIKFIFLHFVSEKFSRRGFKKKILELEEDELQFI